MTFSGLKGEVMEIGQTELSLYQGEVKVES
jgi:hypothetical protein